MARDPSFEVRTSDDVDPGDVLLLGFADGGAASVTALDYLVSRLETTRIGHLAVRNLPVVAPVTEGEPRHPMRLYAVDDAPISILVSEQFVPVGAASAFVAAVFDWATASDVEEIAAVHGAPFPHSEAEHLVFAAGTDAYRRAHFGGEGTNAIEPLPGGVLDGVNAELLVRGLEEEAPAVGVFVTPAHPPGPDLEAALRLLDGLETSYPIDVDERELRQRAEELQQYYETLAARLTAIQQGESALERRDFPEDRMYM